VQLLGLKHLTKLKKKNTGNAKLASAIDALVGDFRKATWKNKDEVQKDRKDADCVHSEGYFFFNIHIHRTLVLIEYTPVEETREADESLQGIVNIHWAGSHDEYERTFKNSRTVIDKWLRNKGLID